MSEYKMVPVVPTEAMLDAMEHWIDRAICNLSTSEDAAECAYIDLLAAAPALATAPEPQACAVDDALQGFWPHPISGWVRGSDFVPVSGADTESRLAQGWQPVSHVPPSFSFDPAALSTSQAGLDAYEAGKLDGYNSALGIAPPVGRPAELTEGEREALELCEAYVGGSVYAAMKADIDTLCTLVRRLAPTAKDSL